MKRTGKMLLLAAVLAAAVIGYLVLSNMLTKQEAESDNGDTISIASVEKSSIAALTWDYDGQSVTLKKMSDSWVYPEDAAFPLDLSKVENMLTAVATVSASRAIENAADLSEYGLDQPGSVITVLRTDGTQVVYSIGSKNPVTNEYYLRVDDAPTVYLVGETLRSAFAFTLNGIVSMDPIPSITQINAFAIETPEGRKKIVALDAEEAKGISYSDEYQWFYEVKSGNATAYSALGTSKVESLQNQIVNLAWKSCEDHSASEEEMAAYGLSEPQITVTVNHTVQYSESVANKETFVLLIGNRTENGVYATIQGSGMVYLIDAAVADAMLAADYKTLRPDDVCLMNWDTVDSMDITVDGKKMTVTFTRPETSESDSEHNTTYLVNGKSADSSKVEALLDSIRYMYTADQTEDSSGAGEAEVSIMFYRNTADFKTMTLRLLKYNTSYDLVDFIGEKRLLVNKASVGNIREAFLALSE